MKYASKLMVVPYVPTIENPEETHVYTVDQDMEDILHNQNIKNEDDKIKLYYQALLKYRNVLERYNMTNASSQNKSMEVFASQIADKMYDKLAKKADTGVMEVDLKQEPTVPAPITHSNPNPKYKNPTEKKRTVFFDDSLPQMLNFEDTINDTAFYNTAFEPAIDDTNYHLIVPETPANKLESPDLDNISKLATPAPTATLKSALKSSSKANYFTSPDVDKEGKVKPTSYQKNGAKYNFKPYKDYKDIPLGYQLIQQGERSYLIHDGAAENYKKAMYQAFPAGIDVQKTLDHMKDQGLYELGKKLHGEKRQNMRKSITSQHILLNTFDKQGNRQEEQTVRGYLTGKTNSTVAVNNKKNTYGFGLTENKQFGGWIFKSFF